MPAPRETACLKCGEMVPENCVRCRFCGAFTRPDIEQYYMELKSADRPVTYSQPTASSDQTESTESEPKPETQNS